MGCRPALVNAVSPDESLRRVTPGQGFGFDSDARVCLSGRRNRNRIPAPAPTPRSDLGYDSAMKTYLVGGAVRDALLGRPFTERDYVVVGAPPDDLLALGYRPVGKDFPGLPASAERRPVRARPHRTQDRRRLLRLRDALLARRDARGRPRAARPHDQRDGASSSDDGGDVVDPYGGRRDLEARVLRHVSPAFVEDPLRVLRVARFAARFAPLGFTIAPETMQLMQRHRALAANCGRWWPNASGSKPSARSASRRPTVYFEVLRAVRCARGAVPGDRPPVRRAAAREVAPGDRHRRAHAAGAGRRVRAVE